MIDTHAHLYDEYFIQQWDVAYAEMIQAGIEEVWLPNCDQASWEALWNLYLSNSDFCKPMLGLHPTYVKEDFEQQLAFFEKELQSKKVLAIGEIGLDYYWDVSFKSQQIAAFEIQCHWALEHHLWIDVHCRKAYADLLAILKKKEFKDVTGIIHCFSGDAREANTLVDLGFTLGIGGVITYKNANLYQDIQHVPLTHLVLETDAPYLSPVPYRGKPNSPAYLGLIAQKLADYREINVSELIEITSQNARALKAYSSFD
ncbi:TatD family deoxyribonuclease [Cytophagaceae bacterium 50C-KIRBA]|uniref:TatD family deoxyribonuclease n=1 Tax=Aquirufa beregesia TaxID=2516556 RepID=A0ABX0ESC3_9BACT|nr:TatD family hydrolase [Aquirufa beregesia]NGZ43174.1 TatD family deoxyribonuclease [Aquirufa beregesia]